MSDTDQLHLECISRINMTDENKIIEISFDHYMKKLNFLCDNYGVSIRGSIICDIELSNKFGSVLDHFGIQDGDTRSISSNNQIIKDLITLIMKNFLENSV